MSTHGKTKTGVKLTDADDLRVNPILKQLFRIIQDGNHSIHNVEVVAGLGYRTLARWQRQNGARLDSVQAVLNVLGYDLEIVKHEPVSSEQVSAKVGKISV